MEGILPTDVDLTIVGVPAPKRTRAFDAEWVKFVYVEWFAVPALRRLAKHHGMTVDTIIQNGSDLVKHVLPHLGNVRVKRTRKGVRQEGVRLSGTVPRTAMGDMLTGEFMCWGSLGQMSLKDLMISQAYARLPGKPKA